MHHEGVAHRVEGFYDARIGDCSGDALAVRRLRIGQAHRAALKAQRIGRIDRNFPREILRTGLCDDFRHRRAERCENDPIAEPCLSSNDPTPARSPEELFQSASFEGSRVPSITRSPRPKKPLASARATWP